MVLITSVGGFLCFCGIINAFWKFTEAKYEESEEKRDKKINDGAIILSVSFLGMLFCLALSLSGCSISKSYTYLYPGTGKTVKVALDTSDGYNITSDVPFEISCNGSILCKGIPIGKETFEHWLSMTESPDVIILDAGMQDENEYIFWTDSANTSFNYAVIIGDSATGIALDIADTVSENQAKECIERLTVTIEG